MSGGLWNDDNVDNLAQHIAIALKDIIAHAIIKDRESRPSAECQFLERLNLVVYDAAHSTDRARLDRLLRFVHEFHWAFPNAIDELKGQSRL